MRQFGESMGNVSDRQGFFKLTDPKHPWKPSSFPMILSQDPKGLSECLRPFGIGAWHPRRIGVHL